MSLINKTLGVCGGEACVGDTRIAVWLLARLRQMGKTDAELLDAYPDITPEGLVAAWQYLAVNGDEIAQAIGRQCARREPESKVIAPRPLGRAG